MYVKRKLKCISHHTLFARLFDGLSVNCWWWWASDALLSVSVSTVSFGAVTLLWEHRHRNQAFCC